uniref:Uncharacterized protein n=1 Tax=Sander lucioperca TaxID=283035 RepID=A0A8C9ZCE6_SANLU
TLLTLQLDISDITAGLCTMVIILFFSVGLMILSGIAYLIQNWRILPLVLFSPLLLVLGIFYWFLPESARWLMTQGRKEEAQKELRRAARVNGRKVPEDLLDEVSCIKHTFDLNTKTINKPLCDMKEKCFGVALILLINDFFHSYIVNSLLYYGLSLNVGSFGLNIYLTQFIFGIVEIPANLSALALIQHFGRTIVQACFLFFGGGLLASRSLLSRMHSLHLHCRIIPNHFKVISLILLLFMFITQKNLDNTDNLFGISSLTCFVLCLVVFIVVINTDQLYSVFLKLYYITFLY